MVSLPALLTDISYVSTHMAMLQESVQAGATNILTELQSSGAPLVGLVNNAGVAQKYPLEFHPMKDLRNMFDVSILSVPFFIFIFHQYKKTCELWYNKQRATSGH